METLPIEILEHVMHFMDPESLRNFVDSLSVNPKLRSQVIRYIMMYRNDLYVPTIFTLAFNASRGATETENGMNAPEIELFLKTYYDMVPENRQRWALNSLLTTAIREEHSRLPRAVEEDRYRIRRLRLIEQKKEAGRERTGAVGLDREQIKQAREDRKWFKGFGKK